MPTPALTWLFLAALALGSLLGLGALFGEALPSLDADVDSDALGTEGSAASALVPEADGADFWSVLGVGRAPLGLLLSLDLLLFGGVGVVATELFGAWLPAAPTAWAAGAVALVAGPLLGARIARAVARFAPSFETHGAGRRSLVGRFGSADIEIDARFGRARVRDAGGALHLVRCVTRGPVIPAGTALVVVGYAASGAVFEVEHADQLLGAERERARRSPPLT
jgi:hypothetical protein